MPVPCAATNSLLDIVRNDLKHLDREGFVDTITPRSVGGYGDIYTGILLRPTPSPTGPTFKRVKVALKSLRTCMQQDKAFVKSFVKETKIWSNIHHDNIMTLEGYILKDGYPLLISEWCEDGTIIEYISNNPESDYVNILAGIARGLAYLHEMEIVHSDLKGANILAGRSGQPKITDFGLSRMISYSMTILKTTQSGPRGTARWMAYELLLDSEKLVHTEASDIWAYGMVVYEFLTRKFPYHYYHEMAAIFAIAKGETPRKPQLDRQLGEVLWTMAERCWKLDPSRRITAHEAVAFLSEISLSPRLSPELSPTSPTPSSAPDYISAEVDQIVGSLASTKLGDNAASNQSNRNVASTETIWLNNGKALDLSSAIEYTRWNQDEMNVKDNWKFPLRTVSNDGITLISKRYKRLESNWKVQVDAREPMTNCHVLRAIYRSLFIQVEDVELKYFNQKWRKNAKDACERRCRANAGMEGLRRIDFLCNYRWLKGIRCLQKEDSHTYLLLTRESKSAEELALD